MNSPLVSVIMPVYNSEKYLKESVESILNQTMDNFEFIIINDGSTDQSKQILNSYSDSRIRVITNLSNKGNYPSRNIGLSNAIGEYTYVMQSKEKPWMDFAKQYISSYFIHGFCGMNNFEFLKLDKMFGLGAIPANFLLDANHRIIAINLHGEELTKKLQELRNNRK